MITTVLWGMVVLALIGGVAPAGVGWLLSARFDRAVSNLAIPGYLQIAHSDFERGWFVSHAQIVLQPVGPLCQDKPCPVVRLDSRIDQGPLPWGADLDSLVPVLAVIRTRADLTSLWPYYGFSPKPALLRATTRIDLDMAAHMRIALAGTNFDVSNERPVVHAESAPISGDLTFKSLRRGIDHLQLGWPSFSLVWQQGGHLGWSGMHFSAQPGAHAKRRLTADTVTLDNGRGLATRLSGVRLAVQHSGAGTTALDLDIDRLVLPGGAHSAFVLHSKAEGLAPRAWAALPARWEQLGGLSGGALNRAALYRDVLPALLPAGARLRIRRFELTTPEGAIRADAKIAAPKHYHSPTSAKALLSQLEVRAHMSFPASLLRRVVARSVGTGSKSAIDARIQALIKRGLIQPMSQGQRYRTQVFLDSGQMIINGRKRPEWRRMVTQFQAAAQGL